MRIIETAWLAQPHPDLADIYTHARLGDSARDRLGRAETLARIVTDEPEGKLAVARAAIEASDFVRARAVLAPLLEQPTGRVGRQGSPFRGARRRTSRSARAACTQQ